MSAATLTSGRADRVRAVTAQGASGPDAATAQAPVRRRRTSAVDVVRETLQAIDWNKIFKVSFMLLFVAYPGVALKIMRMFKCRLIEGQYWLEADMRLLCYTGEWAG